MIAWAFSPQGAVWISFALFCALGALAIGHSLWRLIKMLRRR